MFSRPFFTVSAPTGKLDFPAETPTCRREVNAQPTIKIMGDKSPKATHKKSAQKQVKANSADQKKREAITAKRSAGKQN